MKPLVFEKYILFHFKEASNFEFEITSAELI
jgi:hypothetical protein